MLASILRVEQRVNRSPRLASPARRGQPIRHANALQ
jgi:hypothetical protein